ncbi:hypothetical protein B0T10DRAFT_602223 [Thelonectria olida]|uniref:Zn(2)-C6 fungal-type domain-containing protein n=1 Tax=Thelonectria olida TaxID=1576542 RepID=A0A9P9ARJ4_9HYPO|nr:hypothetical protein B0T10DRAFT_602223 [Thelonectria olida]
MNPRRSHRKSRLGCSECKKRHIKCDESRPSCLNCSRTERQCSFAGLTANIPVASPAPSSTSSQVRSDVEPDPIDVPPANMVQMDLMFHLFSSGGMGLAPVLPLTHTISPEQLVQQALGCDYLMNELLAFAARHLAIIKPDQRAFYLHQASCLQTHALSLFTRAQVKPSRDNCLQVAFFSWVLGNHLLSDLPTDDDHVDILSGFLHYLKVYRGLRVVVMGAWRFLLESEHRALFRQGETTAENLGTGAHTSKLISLVQDSLGLDDAEKAGCSEAIARIQWAFNIKDDMDPKTATEHYFTIAFSWPQLVSPEYLACVQKKRPEALLVLAHFAVVLSWCRNHWIFGSVGARLLESIMSALGPGWETWLQWPRENVQIG